MEPKRPIERSQRLSKRDPNEIIGEILGQRFVDYRRAWQAAENGDRPDFPLHLDVDVTTACNLKCPMCPAGNSGHIFPGFKKGLNLDRELYRQALAEGRRFGLPSIRLGLTGEPLLIQDIAGWVEDAQKAEVPDISLITNGQLLTEEISARLMEAGLTRLMISMDAASEAVYKLTRPGGDWGRLVKNIHGFLNQRARRGSALPLLRLSFVEMSVNLADREVFAEEFGPLADYLSFQRYQNILGAADTDFGPSAPGRPENTPAVFCPEPFTRMAIHADGALFPCCSDFGRTAPLGNLAEKTLHEIWNSEAARKLTGAGGAAGKPCRDCLGRAPAGSLPLG